LNWPHEEQQSVPASRTSSWEGAITKPSLHPSYVLWAVGIPTSPATLN